MPTHLTVATFKSRFPNQEWFKVSEAARLTGWSQSYIIEEIQNGYLDAQVRKRESNQYRDYRQAKDQIITKPHYRIHRNDLILWMVKDGQFDPVTTFHELVNYVQEFPLFLQHLFMKAVNGKDVTSDIQKWHTQLPPPQRVRYSTTGNSRKTLMPINKLFTSSKSPTSSSSSTKRSMTKDSPTSSTFISETSLT